MDSSNPQIRELLEFSCVRPLHTVGGFLEAAGAGAMMDDPLVGVALCVSMCMQLGDGAPAAGCG